MSWLLTFGFAAAIVSATAPGDPPGIGDTAPSLPQQAVRPLTGASTQAPITVVEFFATWCAACQASLRDTVNVLNALDPGQGSHFKLMIVDVGEDEAVVQTWLSEAALFRTTAITLDRDRRAYARWGADRLPTIFVLDSGGIIRHINRGHGKGYRARLTMWLRKRMAEALP